MTDQELYTRTRKHLLTQNKKALRDGYQNWCAYKAKDGGCCAIGHLIPQHKYSPAFEGKIVSNPLVAKAAGLSYDRKSESGQVCGPQIDLARALQNVHDNHEPDLWKDKLDQVASLFDLVVED